MADAAPEMPPEVNAEDWSTALYKALEHAQRTLQTKIEELHVQRSRLGAHDELIEVTQQNVMQEGAQLQAELKAKIGELRKVLDKYETDMVELVKRDEAWMLQSLNEQRGETKTYMDRTDTSLRTLRDDTSSVSTAHEVVERMERDVLSDVVALDYPFTPWNMLVLSDSKDAYTDAEWVPQFVSGLLARLDPARAKELVRPFA
jgi:hypothetical protein